MPRRIAHITIRLNTGGAERSMLRLARETREDFEHLVICLGPRSPIGDEMEAAGIRLVRHDLWRIGPLALWRTWRTIRQTEPDLLQGWMYLGNALASLLGLITDVRVAWNIRQSPGDFRRENRLTRFAIWLGSRSWASPSLTIFNSHAAVAAHARYGFASGEYRVITNGIDTARYRPDDAARAATRAAFRQSVGDDTRPWAGMVCRFHPLKGVPDFLAAIARVGRDRAHWLLAGPGMQEDNESLLSMLKLEGLTVKDVALLGPITTADFLPGLDVLALASHREGTPNILLEAMASGVSCVATRVGDVERILRDDERLAAPGDVDGLARAIAFALDNPADTEQNRGFITSHYAIGACMDGYRQAYAELLDAVPEPQ